MMTENEARDFLSEKLQIPLTAARFKGPYVEVYLNENFLGGVPVMNVKDGHFVFDTSDIVKNGLRWEPVVKSMLQNIKNAVEDFQDGKYNPEQIRIGTFCKLYLHHESEKEPLLVNCTFNGKEWNISK